MRNIKIYYVPPDMSEKEKIIGGIFTMEQFLWLLAGGVAGVLVFISTFNKLGKVLSVIISFPFLLFGLPFAFHKVNDLSLYEYLKRKHNFNKKNKFLVNERKEWS